MSKLIIPAAELIGTPLTQEELKGILAGRDYFKRCQCSLNYGGDEWFPFQPDAKNINSLEECGASCKQTCIDKKCASVTYSFTEGYN
ncbi:MAG: hypothetical protein K2O38_07780 [Muribaculaceae bacterium]|nr:hypothetical protein [Muribaculaceae bacterium]